MTRTIAAPPAVLAEIATAYDIDPSTTCRLLQWGRNDTYLLRGRERCYVARMGCPGRCAPDEIQHEAELLLHLIAQGVSVARPVPARNGALAQELTVPEGPRWLVLFDWVDGAPVSWYNAAHCRAAGQILGKVHAVAGSFVSGRPRPRVDLERLIARPLAALRPFLADRPDDWRFLEELARRLQAEVQSAAAAGLDTGICHGGLSGDSILVDAQGAPTVCGFDLEGPGWRAIDLGAVNWLATLWGNESAWTEFQHGYDSVRQLAPVNWSVVPLFQAIRQISSIGSLAAEVDQWGVQAVNRERLDGCLAFLRRWDADHPADRATR